MRIDLLPPDGTLLKANLHCHTKEQDAGSGYTTPQQIKALYQANGYQIVAFTDHNKLSYRDDLNDDGFLALPGFEVMWNDPVSLKIYHFNCFPKHHGVKEEYFPFDLAFTLENVNKLIKWYVDREYLVMYNHPAASFHGSFHHETEEFLGLKGIFAAEVYNHIVEKINWTGWSDSYYDAMLRSGHKLWAVAADDNHSGWPNLDFPPDSPYSKYMGGFVMIKAKEFSHASVMKALENGDFYACAGNNGSAPQIYSMYIENNRFYADFSPVKSVYLKNSVWHCPHKLSLRDDITHVEFELDSSWKYVRLEITDTNGYRAFGNPYFMA